MQIRKWNETRGAVVAPTFPVSASVAARTVACLFALAVPLGAGTAVAQTDTTPPTLVNVKYNGATVRLTFSEALDETSVPDRRHFLVNVWWSLQRRTRVVPAATVAISDRGVTLTVQGVVPERDTVREAGYYRRPDIVGDKLKDLVGNEVENTWARTAVHVTNINAPTVERAAVNGTALTLTFDEALDTGSVPAGTEFDVTATRRNGSTATTSGTSTAVTINGATVSLTLDAPVLSTDRAVKVSYTKPASNPLQGTATTANEVASFTDEPVSNNTPDTTPPMLGRAEVNGAALKLVFDERLHAGFVPGANAFTVSVGGAERGVTGVSLSGREVRLTLASALAYTDTGVKVRYTKPASNPLQDLAGNEVATFGDHMVTNNSPPPPPPPPPSPPPPPVFEHAVPMLPAASHPQRQGFVRLINRSGEGGEVSIVAFDDAGTQYGPLTLAIGANEAVQFSAADLEAGNAGKGLEGSTGEGEGAWRLELKSPLELVVLSYARARGGALASLHDVAPEDEAGHHRVVFFNPASNRAHVSRLRLINPGEEEVEVRITGLDAAGEAGEGAVVLTLGAQASRSLSAQALETGEGEGLAGALGDGAGKWRLRVIAERPIRVMSLLANSDGALTNVSTAPGAGVPATP